MEPFRPMKNDVFLVPSPVSQVHGRTKIHFAIAVKINFISISMLLGLTIHFPTIYCAVENGPSPNIISVVICLPLAGAVKLRY